MMKIALVVKHLNVRGGTHKQLLRLAEHLHDSGHQVQVFAQSFEPNSTYAGFSRFVVKTPYVQIPGPRWLREQANQLWLAASIATWADVVNVHDLGCEELIVWARTFSSAPVIWQVNDISHVYRLGASASMPELWHYPVRRSAYALVAQLPREITVNVTKNQRRIAQVFRRRSRIFYCGVDPVPCKPRSAHFAGKGPIKVVTTGIFFRYRNYEAVIQTLRYLRENHDIFSELVIVGATRYDEGYANEIRRLAIALDVQAHLLGAIDDRTLEAVYQEADLFMFLNVDQSWGLAIFEAMGYGIPCVISESVGAVEVIQDVKHAVIGPPNAPEVIAARIAALFRNPKLLAEMRQNALALINAMSWRNVYCHPVEQMMRLAAFPLEANTVR